MGNHFLDEKESKELGGLLADMIGEIGSKERAGTKINLDVNLLIKYKKKLLGF